MHDAPAHLRQLPLYQHWDWKAQEIRGQRMLMGASLSQEAAQRFVQSLG